MDCSIFCAGATNLRPSDSGNWILIKLSPLKTARFFINQLFPQQWHHSPRRMSRGLCNQVEPFFVYLHSLPDRLRHGGGKGFLTVPRFQFAVLAP
ncbi:MAG: hypothetical protein FJZ80_01015 [Bacteroidetes bacterium]|nr:hypothetical protein [Bacteroidota bacterium]